MVQVLASVVEAELAHLEVEEECVRVHDAGAGHACRGVAPEAPDAVDVVALDLAAAELALCAIDAQVLLVAHVDQAVVGPQPSEWMMLRMSTLPRIAANGVSLD